ncbi:unnamed protein product [Effrenium voratum]|uniref:Uncharacterized protein n=1 Tax=Effrenium voratum TaxID=2562239 RepID=A0AA36HTT7_9DINO|nr:unnamed protein product [Effrenium voratum]
MGAVGDLSLGKLLTMGYSWRGALTCFGGCVALPLLGSIVMLHRLVPNVHEHSETSGVSYSSKWRRLLSDLNAWLALLLLTGGGCIWALAGYLAVLLKQKFELSSGQSAMAASSLLAGTFLGLLFAGAVTLAKGRSMGRSLQLIQATLGFVAFAVLEVIVKPNLPVTVTCLLLAGAGCGPLLYLPYTAYCSVVPREERAFAMGVLDSVSQASTCLTRIYFGYLRIVAPQRAGDVMYTVSIAGLGIAVSATGWLYARLAKADPASRLARALAELTPDGSALSPETLEERVAVVKAAGKCWSVDAERAAKRAKAAAA